MIPGLKSVLHISGRLMEDLKWKTRNTKEICPKIPSMPRASPAMTRMTLNKNLTSKKLILS